MFIISSPGITSMVDNGLLISYKCKLIAWCGYTAAAFTSAYCHLLPPTAKKCCLCLLTSTFIGVVVPTILINIYCAPVQDYFVTSTKFIIMSQAEGDSEAEERTRRWDRARRKCLNRRIKNINVLMRNDRKRDERELASLAPSSHLTKPVCPCF